MTYAEKLKDPRWQQMRLRVFERDNWTCCSCHERSNTLNAHHAHYVKDFDPWDYPLYSLYTLCESCHAEHKTLFEKEIKDDLIMTLMGGLRTGFIRKCAVEVFTQYDVNDLIYLLWEWTNEFNGKIDEDQLNKVVNMPPNLNANIMDFLDKYYTETK